MWLSVISKSLVDISGNLILVEFGGIFGLAESGRLLRCKVEVSGKFRLIDLGGFFRF